MDQLAYQKMVNGKILAVYPILVDYYGGLIYIDASLQFSILGTDYISKISEQTFSNLPYERIEDKANIDANKAINIISQKLLESQFIKIVHY
jgi:hypothetical protein